MSDTKKEFPASDAEPVVLYGLLTADNPNAVPILCTTAGALLITIV